MRADIEGGGYIDLPLSCEDVRFMNYIEFVHAENKYLDSNNQEEDEDGSVKVSVDEIEEYLIEAVSKIVKGDGLYKIGFSLKGDNMREMVDRGFMLTLGSELSVLRIYAHLITIFRYFNEDLKREHEKGKISADKYEFKQGGEVFVLDTSRARKMFTNTAFTTGEVLELKYFRRKFQQSIEKGHGKNGEFAFNLGLSEVAILCRPEGELLPFDKVEREALITQRVRSFASLGLDVLFTIRFFLTVLLSGWLKEETIQHISTAREAQRTQQTNTK